MNYPIQQAKKQILSDISKIVSKCTYNEEIKLEKPAEELGDFALPCFQFSKLLKKSPVDIASKLSNNIKSYGWIKKIEQKGPYVNFFLDDKKIVDDTLKTIFEKKQKYGYLSDKNKKVIVEHTSANPNGPLHVGRARNPIIGDTIVRIYKAAGYDVESQFYLDDMGKQVAILTWGKNNLKKSEIPNTENDKPDHVNVGFYQAANKLMEDDWGIQEKIGELIKKSEEGDSETIKLIHQAYKPVLDGIVTSLKSINIEIDSFIPESDFVKDKSVDTVIEKLKKSKYADTEDGAYFLDLESFGVKGRNTNFFFLRKDGTSLYATRDTAYHIWKAKQADQLINILGEDHKLESRQVEIALEIVGEKKIPTAIFYSFVSMPGGKMSTRHGRVVYLDDLVDECVNRAYIEVKKRRGDELSEKKMKEISRIVGIGALRYNIIKVQPEKDIVFKWEEALSFEGNAAPFIQYAHARACSILSKKKDDLKKYDASLLTHDSEVYLVKKLAEFPNIINEAYMGFKPHILTSYIFEVSSKFNQFYRDCPVLPEQGALRVSRLALVDATRIVLKNGLELLGINAPEEM